MSVTVAELEQGGKRGRLEGAALSDEVLDSSASVLSPVRAGAGTRGLQQFFTPNQAARLVKQVLDPSGYLPVLDPTAGNGALLQAWGQEQRFGVEIDADQVRAGAYEAITGDLQRAFPLLLKLGVGFPRLAANPPFGLTWTDGAGRAEGSTEGAWRISLALLDEHGVGAFICGRDRFAREILGRADAAGVIATVECDDLFDGVVLPCLIAFFVRPENRCADAPPRLQLSAARPELAGRGLIGEVRRQLERASDYVVPYAPGGELRARWRLVDRELDRRRREEQAGRQRFDVELRAGERLSIRPGPFSRAAMAKVGRLKLVEKLHNQPVGHFALNALDWRMLGELQRACDLSIAPGVAEAVREVAARAEREVIPLYEVRPQMRLGYLTDLDSILCVRGDLERGFVEGQRYSLRTDSRINVTHGEKVTRNKRGEPVVRKYEEEATVLAITIDGQEFSESSEDIAYLLEHFEIPNPGDIATRFPEEVQRQRELLDRIAEDGRLAGNNPAFAWKRFQREDLARALTKTRDGGGFILSWEQGGGKTIGAAGYAQGAVLNGARNRVLFIVPQDLIPQYRLDIREHLGIAMEHVKTPTQAREVAAHLKAGGEGWYITHYEALSLLGVKNEALPPVSFRHRDGNGKRVMLDSSEFCPACHASHLDGWQKDSPLVCSAVDVDEHTGRTRTCGYVHKALKVKSAAHYLSGAFCVIEYTYGRQGSEKQHQREKRKVLPQITNVSRFWRLSAGAMIRRRKADFGEPLVRCTMKTVSVPMGVAQRKLYEHWLSKGRFARFFAWKYPDHPLVESEQIERFAAGCGQLTKLEYATTVPEAATDRDWPGLDGLTHSNWTPKNMKTLEVILEHVKAGEKILVGSDLIETGRWLCDRLLEKGVRAGHIVEERDGKAATVNPRKRAKVMHDFRHGRLQVLLCGIPAIRLGHNLDTASVVIVDGLVFSYEMFDQFIARAHRLSSKKPVSVYVMLTKGSLDEKKWELLCAKAAAADLALDGQLMDEREEPISLEQVLKDLQSKGVPVTGEEIAESELEAAWQLQSSLVPFAPPRREYEPLPPIREAEQLELFAA